MHSFPPPPRTSGLGLPIPGGPGEASFLFKLPPASKMVQGWELSFLKVEGASGDQEEGGRSKVHTSGLFFPGRTHLLISSQAVPCREHPLFLTCSLHLLLVLCHEGFSSLSFLK